jgi:hypothetical protein
MPRPFRSSGDTGSMAIRRSCLPGTPVSPLSLQLPSAAHEIRPVTTSSRAKEPFAEPMTSAREHRIRLRGSLVGCALQYIDSCAICTSRSRRVSSLPGRYPERGRPNGRRLATRTPRYAGFLERVVDERHSWKRAVAGLPPAIYPHRARDVACPLMIALHSGDETAPAGPSESRRQSRRNVDRRR